MRQVLPKYYFSGEFQAFYPELLTLPHREKFYRAGELLGCIGEPGLGVFFFRSGLVQCYAEHEDGHRKSLSFHGPGNIFPGVQKVGYKIEKSLMIKALTDTEATAFDRGEFYRFSLEHPLLLAQLYEMQSAYINMLIYDAAHQRFNHTFLKVCNFLFLMARGGRESTCPIAITQENIADTLGVGRNHVTKSLSRLRQENIIRLGRCRIEIIDGDKLAAYCSQETIDRPFL